MFCPDHKAAMVLFLDRVYGIKDQNYLLHLLEVGFLPDLQAAVSLDTVSLFAALFICLKGLVKNWGHDYKERSSSMPFLTQPLKLVLIVEKNA